MHELEERVQYLLLVRPDGATVFHEVARGIYGICAAIDRLHLSGRSRAEVLPAVQPARQAASRSPLLQRMQAWPRGHRGDFETVDQLRSGVNRAPPGSLARSVERFALQMPLAQVRRDAMHWQALSTLRAVRDARARLGPTHAPRVLLIGCGSAPDMQLVAGGLGDHGVRLVLNDLDEGALAAAAAALRPWHLDTVTVVGNVLHCLPQLQHFGPYDLVVAGEVLDYLTTRQAADLLRIVYSLLLVEGGRFLFTNAATENPWRSWLDYFVDWSVAERSEEDLRELCGRAGIPAGELAMRRDPSQLVVFADLGRTW